MTGLVDSHVHLDRFDEEGCLDEILDRAAAADVRRLVAIGGGEESNARVVRICRDEPDRVVGVVGYDRDEATANPDPDRIRALLPELGIVGIGETGLDYHYERDTAEAQKRLLRGMLDCAAGAGLPVVLHSREADDDTLALLVDHVSRWEGRPDGIGVLHCFTGTRGFAERLVELGLYISFSGIVTFKKSDALREVAAWVPEDRILVETDAPYLAPVPHRGKRNEPAFVRHTAEAIASIRGWDLEQAATITTANAERLFGLGRG